MKQINPCRQGDVMFHPIAKLPKGEQKQRKDGSVAYGEVTGHAHSVMTAETAEVIEIGDGIYVRVAERGISIEGDIARILPDVERIVADEGEDALRREAAGKLLKALPAAGAIFLHGTAEERAARPVPIRGEDRHLPVALAPGLHSVGIQREYAPGAIRNVID